MKQLFFKKTTIILVLLFFFVVNISAKSKRDTLRMGFAPGYISYQTFKGDFFYYPNVSLIPSLHDELNVGFTLRYFPILLNDIQDLTAISGGLFCDYQIYPFKKVFL